MKKEKTIFGTVYHEKELKEILNGSDNYSICVDKKHGKQTDYICDCSSVPFFIVYCYKIINKNNSDEHEYIYTRWTEDDNEENIEFDY